MLHGCCTEASELIRALFLRFRFYLQNNTFSMWACLDSNQGPLPYQLGRGFPAGFRPVWKLPLFGGSWNLRRLRFTAPFASVLTRLQYGCSTLVPSPRAYRYGFAYSDRRNDMSMCDPESGQEPRLTLQDAACRFDSPDYLVLVTDAVGGLEYPNSSYTAKLACTIRRARDERQG